MMENNLKKLQESWSSNPENWKFGLFYFNDADKRLFPPKKSKIGYTVNFANPVSVIAGLAVTVLTVIFTIGLVVAIKSL